MFLIVIWYEDNVKETFSSLAFALFILVPHLYCYERVSTKIKLLIG